MRNTHDLFSGGGKESREDREGYRSSAARLIMEMVDQL